MRKWYRWYPLLLVAVTLVISVIAYPKLPDQVPTHWGVNNDVNGYSPRWAAVILMPGLILAFAGWFRVMPKIDPRGANYEKFAGAYDIMVATVLTLLAALHVIIMAAAVGYAIDMGRVAVVLVGLVFISIGNVMPQARPNWFVGVKTPWTLSNDRVWERTHRVFGYLMVIAGALTMTLAVVPARLVGPGIAVLGAGAAVGSILYSYFAWRQETSR